MGAEPFTRSTFDPATGTSTSNPRQQVNANTSFLDLSQVYGSSDVVEDALRSHSGGQLKTSPGNLLPYNNLTYFTQAQLNALNMANDAHQVPDANLFAAGDVRANANCQVRTVLAGRIPPEASIESPAWYENLDTTVASFPVTGRVAASRVPVGRCNRSATRGSGTAMCGPRSRTRALSRGTWRR